MYFNRRYKTAIWIVSISIVAILFTIILLFDRSIPSEKYFIPIEQRINNSIVMGLIIALLPPGIIELNNGRWLKGVEVNIPRLLRDVTEMVTSGLPLTTALEKASASDYGPVSKPLGEAMVRFSLTSDFAGALAWLGNKLVKPVAKRMCSVLVEAYASGGKIIEVLSSSVELFTNLAEFKEEKASQMRPYIFVVYLGSIIFLVISTVVLVQFIKPLTIASTSSQEGGASILQNVLDIRYYKSILFWAAVMESIFSGIIAGKMSSGRINAGLIHSVVLLSITLTFYNSIIF